MILALDLATTTGWALGSRLGSSYTSGVECFRRTKGEGPGAVFAAARSFLLPYAGLPDLEIVYERPRTEGGGYARAQVLFGLTAVVLMHAHIHGCRVLREVPPATLKKWTTGSGAAKKEQMVVAVATQFHPPTLIDHNHADAIALLHYARRHR